MPKARGGWACGVLCAGAMACSGPDAPADAGSGAHDALVVPIDAPSSDAPSSDGSASMGTLIDAVAGGIARSADGNFEIWVTPGALSADTTITITPIAAGDVPSDIAARDPVSTVYAVEPDGLTFGGDGAWAHYAFDPIPTSLRTLGSPPTYAGARAAMRPASGGATDVSLDNSVAYDLAADRVDVIARLAHLSFQWAEKAELRTSAEMGSVIQQVGAPWNVEQLTAEVEFPPHPPNQSRVLSSLVVAGFGTNPVVASLPSAVTLPPDLRSEAWAHAGVAGLVGNGYEAALAPLGSGPSPRRLSPPAPQFVCTATGTNAEQWIFTSARYATIANPDAGPPPDAGFEPGSLYHVNVYLGQAVDCVAPPFPPIGARVDSHASCVREGLVYTCPAPTATADVGAPPAGTTVNLAPPGPYFIRLTPIGGTPGAGPAAVTATDGSGSAMHATREAAGTYQETFDDPATFDFDSPISFSADTSGPFVLQPPTAGGFRFAPIAGLSTDVEVDPGIDYVDVEITHPSFVCQGSSYQEGFFYTRAAVTDLGAGARGLDAPVQTLLDNVASYCGITTPMLTAGAFSISLRVASDRTVDVGTSTMRVSTGRSTTIDGQSLLATCPGTQTYCTDRCVNTATDPMNCGGCGLRPLEVCDAADNDCDGNVDERCPTAVFMYAGNNQVSPHYGDTTTPAGTFNTPTCGSNAIIGLCGSTNPDGSVRQLRAVCGSMTLRRITTTTPYSFVVDVAELSPGSCETQTTSGGWTGGTTQWAIRCPTGMVADGIQGQESGNLEQLELQCSSWSVAQDLAGVWLLRRGTRGTSPVGASGSGTPFGPFMIADAVDGQPGVLRQLSVRYMNVVAGHSDVIDLWAQGRTAELR